MLYFFLNFSLMFSMLFFGSLLSWSNLNLQDFTIVMSTAEGEFRVIRSIKDGPGPVMVRLSDTLCPAVRQHASQPGIWTDAR